MKLHLIAYAALALACAGASAPPNLVVSTQSPTLTLSIDRTFRPLKPLRFPIENLTNAERRIFVHAARNGVIDRMVIIQFEKVQAGSDFRFVYPSKPPRQFGAETYRFGTFAYNDEGAAKRMPKKEPGLTRAFLSQTGYVSARLYRVARLARVSDPNGLSEVIIFYMENADASPPSGTADEDGNYALTGEEAAALTAHMEQAVRVVKG